MLNIPAVFARTTQKICIHNNTGANLEVCLRDHFDDVTEFSGLWTNNIIAPDADCSISFVQIANSSIGIAPRSVGVTVYLAPVGKCDVIPTAKFKYEAPGSDSFRGTNSSSLITLSTNVHDNNNSDQSDADVTVTRAN